MREKISFRSSDEVTTIQGYVWKPAGKPKGIVQLTHGMVEYILRYDELATKLSEAGYVVFGTDLLGHGRSVVNKNVYGYFGERNGNWKLISDMVALRDLARRTYPGIPYYLFGHSFGSLLVREFVQRFPDNIDGCIIMGTMYKSAATAAAGLAACESVAKTHKDGYRYRSTFLNDLAFGGYDKHFREDNLRNAWLNRDLNEVQIYNNQPECNFIFTVGAYRDMMVGLREVVQGKNLDRMNPAMPILLMSGAEDPVGDFGKAPKKLYHIYKKRGFDVRLRLYDGARHELIHELNKEQVVRDLIKWLDHYSQGDTDR